MILKKFIPSEFASNNYLLYSEKTKNAVLFDCSKCFDEISKFIQENELNLKYIIITHVHFDHVEGVKKFKETYKDAEVLLPLKDKILYDNLTVQCDMFCVKRVEPFNADRFITEHDSIYLDDVKIEVIETPGHSAGSTCYLVEDMLISGDTLFFEEIGRCDLPTSSYSDITNSIKNKLFKLNDEIKVFPGHGDDTTIWHEKVHNRYFGLRA